MKFDKSVIRDSCTDAVFERAQTYRDEGRIQQLDRFDTNLTAVVQGSQLYEVVAELEGDHADARCTCPYTGPGHCKHIVAVLLDVAADPPQDESERVESVLKDISVDDLRAFVRDVLADHPGLRELFLARFESGDGGKSFEESRAEIEDLFDQHTQDYPVVTDAIDFTHFFGLAEQYRDRDQYLAATAVYRALLEGSTTTRRESTPRTTTTRNLCSPHSTGTSIA